MNISLYRKLKMYVVVLAYLKKQIVIWTSSAPFTSDVEALEAGIDAINALDQVEKKSISVSKGKKQKKKTMIDATMVVCSSGMAYASFAKDDALKVKFNYSPSSLSEGNEGDVYARCVNVGTAALPILANLIKFNMPPTQLDILTAATDAYNLTITDPKAVISAHKSANKEMKAKFKEMDVLLDEGIDTLVYTYKAAQPTFFTEYHDTRFIGGWSRGTPPPVPPVVPTPPTV